MTLAIADAILDPAIEFNKPMSPNWKTPKAIFLTGATGFFGAYLLDELLQQTEADIYCLIRSHNAAGGKERIQRHLDFYSLWQENYNCRIIPVVGDLSQPLFGLLPQQFSQLAEQIDIIYHNGSQPDFDLSYSQLKGTNVLGTQEILRLAALNYVKPVHYVSTVAVFFSHAYHSIERIYETDIPILDAGLHSGYKQSKWVAEQLMTTAINRGLPACIYRPNRIMGDSKTGIYGKFDNFFLRLIKACIELKKFPAFELELNFVPVDYASQAMVYLSLQEKSFSKTFHLVNPQGISWKNLFELINQVGYSVEAIPHEHWLEVIKSYQGLEQPDTSYFVRAAKVVGSKKPQFDARYTLEGLANTIITCCPINKELLTTYFSYFQKTGYLAPLIPEKKIN